MIFRRQMTLGLVLAMCVVAVSSLHVRDAAAAASEAELIKIIKGSAPRAAKDAACRELQVVGTEACIDALAVLLVDEATSHMARYALEPMGYPKVGKALRDALGKTKGVTKVGIITSLGFRKDAQAVGQLARLLGDADANVAASAAAALGRIGTPTAAKALDALRARAKGPLRAVAAEASLTAAERLVEQGQDAQAAAICADLQGADWPPHVRLGAFVGLLGAGGDKAVDMAVAAIAGSDAGFRAAAIANSGSLKGAGVAKRLAGQLAKLPPDAQVLLIGALAVRGDTAVRAEIVTAAGSADDAVRVAAVVALARLGDVDCLPVLYKALVDGKSDAEKRSAVNSMQVLPGETVNPALLACMKRAPVAARAELIETLALRRAGGIVGDLVTEAKGPDAAVRAAAVKALGQLAGPSDLPALLGLLVAPKDPADVDGVERAVVRVARKIAESARADAVLAALGKSPATPVRCSLLRTLGGIGNAKAFKTVVAALSDTNADVADAAVRALSSWPDARALDACLRVFRTSGSMVHRVLALRGCVRLLGLSDRKAGEKLAIFAELMKTAKRGQDRRLVLSGIAGVADPAAVAAVKPYLRDAEVKDEAELALLAVARSIRTSHPAQAKAAAQALLKSKNRTIRRDATRLVRDLSSK